MFPDITPALMLFLMLTGHFVADYGLQTQYMAVNKSSRSGNPDWAIVLLAHSSIHGFMVALLTGSVLLGVAEIVAHFVLDELKSRKMTSYWMDQAGHFSCKVIWWMILPLLA